ncbi:MAG: phosphotransferase [Spirosomataceae bacterium]
MRRNLLYSLYKTNFKDEDIEDFTINQKVFHNNTFVIEGKQKYFAKKNPFRGQKHWDTLPVEDKILNFLKGNAAVPQKQYFDKNASLLLYNYIDDADTLKDWLFEAYAHLTPTNERKESFNDIFEQLGKLLKNTHSALQKLSTQINSKLLSSFFYEVYYSKYSNWRENRDFKIEQKFFEKIACNRVLRSKIMKVLKKIRGEDIIHGDLKPENILIKTNSSPILIDWEMACRGQATDDIAFLFYQIYLKYVIKRFMSQSSFTDYFAKFLLAYQQPKDSIEEIVEKMGVGLLETYLIDLRYQLNQNPDSKRYDGFMERLFSISIEFILKPANLANELKQKM